jgi:hypothetical protein
LWQAVDRQVLTRLELANLDHLMGRCLKGYERSCQDMMVTRASADIRVVTCMCWSADRS